jgi:hypothetical protein
MVWETDIGLLTPSETSPHFQFKLSAFIVAQLFILGTEPFLTRPSGAKWEWGENGTLTKNLFGQTARRSASARSALVSLTG